MRKISANEKHYTPKQIAQRWSVSPKTVQRIFEDVSGVVKLGEIRRRLLIPESVLRDYYRQHVNV